MELPLKTESGRRLLAKVTVESLGAITKYTFESRGGSKASGAARNPEYYKAVTKVLQDLKKSNMMLDDAFVSSKRLDGLDHAEKQLRLKRNYPISLGELDEDEFKELREDISKSVSKVGRSKGARSPGNRTRRLTLVVIPSGPISQDVISILRAAREEANKYDDIREIIESQEEVFNRFSPLFQPRVIDSIDESSLRDFLAFQHNKHWTNLQRSGKKIFEDMDGTRAALAKLVDEALPLESRIQHALDIAGVGEAIATAILHVASQGRYGVWNNTSEKSLAELGLLPKFKRGISKGERYVAINQVLWNTAKALGVDLWTLDAIWWVRHHVGDLSSLEPKPKSKDSFGEDVVAEDIWDQGYSVLFTSFWGWDPETWGTVGWTGQRGLTRRTNLLSDLTDPFIVACYITSNKSDIDPELKGKIAGYMLVSHEVGDRDDFTHPIHHGREPRKWRHSLKAVRAFSYLPEYRLGVEDLDRDLLARARSVGSMCEDITTNRSYIERLRQIPSTEVEVYAPVPASRQDGEVGEKHPGMVRGGPASSEGYVVSRGSMHLPREIYILRLIGNLEALLDHSTESRSVIKIGLAASPDMRRQFFQKAIPECHLKWVIDRTTTSCGFQLFPNHQEALIAENAMKRYLSNPTHAKYLGGEFYLASEKHIDAAWELGCETAKELADN